MTREEADRASRDASLVLAMTLPGDTVLYLLLPLHAAVFGVSLAEAGLLLAANRLVRILGYGWVARGYEVFGPRRACLVAVLAAACATTGYALLPGVWWLLPARLLWGLAFAAMNIATQALATAEPSGASRRSGASRGIIAAGPMIGLLAGAALAEVAGPRIVFLCLGAVSLVGLVFAWRLPRGENQGEAVKLRAGGPRFALPRSLDVWSFVQGFALDGLFVLGLAFLAAQAMPEGAALAAGGALAARYLAEVLLGPPAGRLAERFGAARVLLVVTLASAAGLAVIGVGWLWVGSLMVVGLRGLLQPLPAPVAASRAPPEERVAALARMATWRDIGAGVGPLAAGVLLPLVPAVVLYLGAAAVLVASSVHALRR
ncbi:MFS transporter [Falsiroseomonas ponticola]|uniref:MFS transporter n=1 Tax=Falsiroseomonas ponticola TaxID=2786951 RepID=UPI0019340000|nr:MFS transporter [Roseomonas ponticola]